MRGGKRAGAGRPRGSANRRSREVADIAAASGTTKLPLNHLLDILNDPQSSQARRDRAAEVACPYLHPRLNAVAATVNTAPRSGDTVATVDFHVWALPRGCQIGEGNLVIWPDGRTEPAPELTPFTPSPDWTLPALTDRRAEPEPARFEVEELEPPENVANLGAYRRSREEPSDESGAA